MGPILTNLQLSIAVWKLVATSYDSCRKELLKFRLLFGDFLQWMLERRNRLGNRQYRSWMYLRSQHPLILLFRPKIAENRLDHLPSFVNWVRSSCLVRPSLKGLVWRNESSLGKKHEWFVLSISTLSYYHLLQVCCSPALGHVQVELFARDLHCRSNMDVYQLQSVYAWLKLAQCRCWWFKLGSYDQNQWLPCMKVA